MKPYPTYKESGVVHLSMVPSTWKVVPLKSVADAFPSNVDKKTKEGETSVLLCNYVDVYKNELITDSIHFMKASASESQVEKFKLCKGDVLATKDSEDPTDIAIPALVPKGFENVICGYHLTVIRPKGVVLGDFIYRYLQSSNAKDYFFIEAKGVTRYGLSVSAFTNIRIPIPTLSEQTQIASYLTQKTTELDTAISHHRSLIGLLEEERAAVINEAVTRGLDPDVAMKDSGVEWLGEVPEHWGITRLKYVTNKIIDGTHFTPTYIDVGVPFLRVKDIKKKEINLDEVKYISQEEHEELSKRCQPEKGDILLSKNGTIGILKVVDWDYEFSLFVSVCLIKPRTMLSAEFFKWFFRSNAVDQQIKESSKTTSVTNLHLDKIRELIMVLPGIEEQNAIAEFVKVETEKIEEDITSAEQEIALLEEYRQALITEVVTGKVDVRGWQNSHS